MTLREKLGKIAQPYDIFPDLLEEDKARNHRRVKLTKEAYDLLTDLERCANEEGCSGCTHYFGLGSDCINDLCRAAAEVIRRLTCEVLEDDG